MKLDRLATDPLSQSVSIHDKKISRRSLCCLELLTQIWQMKEKDKTKEEEKQKKKKKKKKKPYMSSGSSGLGVKPRTLIAISSRALQTSISFADVTCPVSAFQTAQSVRECDEERILILMRIQRANSIIAWGHRQSSFWGLILNSYAIILCVAESQGRRRRRTITTRRCGSREKHHVRARTYKNVELRGGVLSWPPLELQSHLVICDAAAAEEPMIWSVRFK